MNNTQLKQLDGIQLAKLCNSLDWDTQYELILRIEDEMEYRYTDSYVNQLLENKK
jgi:recombinational DNA repair protein RecR